MLTASSKIISIVFHPLLLTLYAFLFIWTFSPVHFAGINDELKLRLVVIVTLNTLLFPILSIFIMRRLGFVNSFYLKEREERIIPYIAISIFYFWTFMVVKKLALNPFFTSLTLGASLSVFMAFFFNLFTKISIHTTGAGNFIAIVLLLAFGSRFNLELPVMITLIAIGLIGSARLRLSAHTSSQVYFGYVIGIAGQLIAYFSL